MYARFVSLSVCVCARAHHKLKTDKAKNTPSWSHTDRVVCQLSGPDPGLSEGEEGRERNDREMRDILFKKRKESEKDCAEKCRIQRHMMRGCSGGEVESSGSERKRDRQDAVKC